MMEQFERASEEAVAAQLSVSISQLACTRALWPPAREKTLR